jgi:hypothetical protein
MTNLFMIGAALLVAAGYTLAWTMRPDTDGDEAAARWRDRDSTS